MSGRVHSEPFALLPEHVLDADVSDRAIRLFAVLTRYADRDGRAFPSRPKLAERLRCGVSSLDRALVELVEVGAVTAEAHYRSDGSRAANSYWLWPSVPPGRTAPPVTPPLPSGEGTPSPAVTPPLPTGDAASSNESQRNESQMEREKGTALAVVPPAPAPRACRLPEPFMLTAEMREWGQREYPGVDLRAETAKFVDHWRAQGGARARKVDWSAAWRNWIRKAAEWRPNGNGNGHLSKSQQSRANLDLWLASSGEVG